MYYIGIRNRDIIKYTLPYLPSYAFHTFNFGYLMMSYYLNHVFRYFILARIINCACATHDLHSTLILFSIYILAILYL